MVGMVAEKFLIIVWYWVILTSLNSANYTCLNAANALLFSLYRLNLVLVSFNDHNVLEEKSLL